MSNKHSRLKVAVVGPFTGQRKIYGDMMKESLRSFNLSHEYLFFNDGADINMALNSANEIVKNNVDVVIGHFNSACAQTAYSIYKDYDFPVLLPAATADNLTLNRNYFRLCSRDKDNISALLDYLSNNDVEQRLLWDDGSSYGIFLHQKVKKLMKEKGVFREFDESGSGAKEIICFGECNSILDYINSNNDPHCKYIVCDDCNIDTFFKGLADRKNIYINSPGYSYNELFSASIDMVERFDPNDGINLNDYIKDSEWFNDHKESNYSIPSISNVGCYL